MIIIGKKKGNNKKINCINKIYNNILVKKNNYELKIFFLKKLYREGGRRDKKKGKQKNNFLIKFILEKKILKKIY